MLDGMSLTERVAAHADRLTAADRRILEVLLSHPTEATYLPASDVTARAGVHAASATKLAQKLGYSGYPELRRSLQADVLDGSSPVDRVTRRIEHAGEGNLLDSLVADEVAALRDLSRQVSQQDLDRAADLLSAAHHRYLFAHGNSTVLAGMLARRLRRFGLPTSELERSGRGMAEQLVGLRPDDVVVAFAFLRTPPLLMDLADATAAAGASLVLVTDTLAAELDGIASLSLSGARGSGREFQSLTVPMAITNALVLTVARRAPQPTTSALARLEKLLSVFEH